MNILIAEDDDTSRILLKSILEKEGYNVLESSDGAEAWERYNDDNISLLVLDWMMPGMDGLEVCRQIREAEKSKEGKYTYIIMLTAKDSTEDIVEAMSYGADDYITKPFHRLELLVRVRAGERIVESKEKLVESEEKYRTIFQNSPVGIYYSDLYGKIIDTNKKALELICYEKEELIKKSFLELGILKENEILKAEELVNESKKGLPTGPFEFTFIRKDGKKIIVEVSSKVLNLGKKRVVVILVQDITERKQAEKRELKIKDAAIETSINPIIMADVKGRLTYANTSFLDMWRFDTIEKVIGKDILELFRVAEDGNDLISSLNERGRWSGELIAKRNDGIDLNIQLSANMIRDENEEPIRMMFSAVNITQQKMAWNALLKSEERYRVLSEASADGIFATNKDGRISYLNPALEKMYGIRSAHALGAQFNKHLSKRASEQFEQIFNDLKNQREVKTLELEIVREDGSILPVEVNAAPVIKDGEFDGVECTLRDITERKLLEETLRDSYAKLQVAYSELQEVDQMKTDFVSVVTHELLTPLTIIQNNLDLFLDGTFGDMNEDQNECLEMTFRNIKRLIELVRDSLDMSRIYGGRLELNYDRLSLQEMFESIVYEMKVLAEEKGHDLSFNISDSVSMVECDKDKIKQVLINLLNNAIKFTPDGGKILLRAQNNYEDNMVVIEVSDNGIGIPEEEHDNIFKQFYEVNSYLHHSTGGTGLGLSIAKGIIEAHGGKIWVESTPKVGSTFSFTIKGGKR